VCWNGGRERPSLRKFSRGRVEQLGTRYRAGRIVDSPVTNTLPSLNNVAVWVERDVLIFDVAVNVPATGSNNSAVAVGTPVASRPPLPGSSRWVAASVRRTRHSHTARWRKASVCGVENFGRSQTVAAVQSTDHNNSAVNQRCRRMRMTGGTHVSRGTNVFVVTSNTSLPATSPSLFAPPATKTLPLFKRLSLAV